MTQPTLTVELGYLSGWTLGTSLLGTDTYLATVDYSQDISDLVRSVSIRRGRQHELNRVEAGTASVMVLNQDGAMTRIPPMTAIRIRGGFGETPAVPFPSVSGLLARYDFSDIATLWKDTGRTVAVTADGDIIKGVTDKSSTGTHLSEATNGPTYKIGPSGINGESVALADGVNDSLSSTNITQAQPFTLIALAKHATGTGAQQYLVGVSGGGVQLYQRSTGRWGYFAGTEQDSGVDVDTDAHVLVGVFNGASSKLYVDGGTAATTANPGSGGWVAQSIAMFNDSVNKWNGSLGEALLYSGALSTADINSLGVYLADHWGTTWTTAV